MHSFSVNAPTAFVVVYVSSNSCCDISKADHIVVVIVNKTNTQIRVFTLYCFTRLFMCDHVLNIDYNAVKILLANNKSGYHESPYLIFLLYGCV